MIPKIRLPFEIRGKLSTTPEQAKRMFGYDMKPGAKGIVLYRRNGRIIIRSLMPQRATPKSVWRKNQDKKFEVLGGIVRDYNDSLIRPIWGKNKGIYSAGCKKFISFNMRLLGNPPDWFKLLLTVGELPKPIVSRVIRDGGKIRLRVSNANDMEIGFALFDWKCLKLYCIAPNRYKDPTNIELPFSISESIKSPFLYVYFKESDEYSVNASTLVTSVGGH